MLEEETRTAGRAEEYLRRLKVEYRAGQREIDRQLQQFYRMYIEENGAPVAAIRKKLSKAEWRGYEKGIAALLESTGKTKDRKARNQYLSSRITRLEALRNQTELQLELIGKSQEASMLRHLQETYCDTYYHNAFYSAKAGLSGNFNRLNPRKVEEICKIPWSGKSFSERVWDNTEKLKREVRRLLSTGSICGTPVKVMSQKLAARMGVSYHRAECLVRTESAYIREKATFAGYEKTGVEKYRILATLDSRTSSICQAMDGKVFDIKDAAVGENYPPLHPNCRSTTVPEYDDFKIGSTRAAKDEDKRAIEVPADMTYPEWYQKYIAQEEPPKAYQKPSFTAATTLEEAERYAVEALGIGMASYKGCDLEVANAWNEGLQDNFARFPKLRERISFTGEAHERNKLLKIEMEEWYYQAYQEAYPHENDAQLRYWAKEKAKKWMRQLSIPRNAMALSWQPKQEFLRKFAGVTLNGETAKSAEKMKEALKADAAQKFHPIGCDTIRYLLDHELGHQLDHLLGLRELSEIQELFNRRTKKELTEALSEYSWNNRNPNRYAEMIAEAWAEYCSSPEPREIARQIGEIIEQEYTKRFGGR